MITICRKASVWIRAILSAGLLLAAAAVSQAQSLRKPVTASGITMEAAMNAIERNSDYTFLYDNASVNTARLVSIRTSSTSLSAVMAELLAGTNLTYSIQKSQIVLYIAAAEKPSASAGHTGPRKGMIVGSVVDAIDKEPLIGAYVLIKDQSASGTTTDLNGNFVLEAREGDVILVSYVGYHEYSVKVGAEERLEIAMIRDSEPLGEAVVVGYGTQRKVSLIGAQQNVSVQELKVPVANLTQSLVGRVAGLISMQRSGEPGYDDATMYIRGISTLTASLSAPLTLVDGVPRSISQVDPEDIESFTILKDASATAIYGVRGANGVIIINTKSGKVGKPRFDIRYTEGMTHFIDVPDFVDAPTYMTLSNEARYTRRSALTGDYTPVYTEEEIEMTRNGVDPYLYPNVNWMDVIFRKFGHNRTANANISGGSEMATYYVGLSFFDETGMYFVDDTDHDYNSNTRYTRYSVTSNITLKPTRTTEIKLGIQGYLANGSYPGSTTNKIFSSTFYATPNYICPKYPNGAIGDRPSDTVQQPYALLNEMGYREEWKNQIFSNLRITQELPFVKGLSLTGMFSFDAYNFTSNKFNRSPNTFMALGRDAEGALILQQTMTGKETLSYSHSQSGNRSVYMEAALNYKRKFGKHDVSGLLLFNQSDEKNTNASTVENALPYRFRGLAGRYTYAYDDRYFIEFNFGYNGSENFSPKHRYGFFPSFGLGWAVSNETWFKPLRGVIQFMKLRATGGIVGNSKIPGRRFAYLATVDSATGYSFGQTSNQTFSGKAIGDEAVDVSWETERKINLGVDMMTLNNKLNLQVDVFKNDRDGIFLTRGSLPAYTGINKTPLGNLGKVSNKGVEFSLDYHNQINSDWFVSALGNFSFNRNRLLENDQSYTYPWQEKRGQRIGQRFGLVAEKLFESDEEVAASPFQAADTRAGDIKFKDINADGKIDDFDQVPIGWGTVPEIIYGFGFTVAWKSVALSTMFQGASHVDALVSGEGVTPFMQGFTRGNIMSNISDRWTEENPKPDAFYPRLSPSSTTNLNYEPSTWFLKPTHYIRLKNLQLTYTLPSSFVKRIRMQDASVFFMGVNLFTISPFKLWDVEHGDGKGNSYPNTASYSLGLNIKF